MTSRDRDRNHNDEKTEYPLIDSAIVAELQEKFGLREGFKTRVEAWFLDGVVQCAARAIGKRLRKVSQDLSMGQAALGRAVGLCRGAVNTWFIHGIKSFDGLVMASNELRLEFGDVGCPPCNERVMHGYLAAIEKVNSEECGHANTKGMTPDEWECLREIYRNLDFHFALVIADHHERMGRMESLAQQYETAVRDRLGRKPRFHGAADVMRIFETWKVAFLLAFDAIPQQWLGRRS